MSNQLLDKLFLSSDSHLDTYSRIRLACYCTAVFRHRNAFHPDIHRCQCMDHQSNHFLQKTQGSCKSSFRLYYDILRSPNNGLQAMNIRRCLHTETKEASRYFQFNNSLVVNSQIGQQIREIGVFYTHLLKFNPYCSILPPTLNPESNFSPLFRLQWVICYRLRCISVPFYLLLCFLLYFYFQKVKGILDKLRSNTAPKVCSVGLSLHV